MLQCRILNYFMCIFPLISLTLYHVQAAQHQMYKLFQNRDNAIKSKSSALRQ